MQVGLGDVLRLRSVHRWHIIGNLKPQTVADHTFGVMVILDRMISLLNQNQSIVAKAGAVIGAAGFRHSCMTFALYHDIEEAFLGDMPAPAKVLLRRVNGNGLENLEDLLGYSEVQQVWKIGKKLVQLADTYESMSYLMRYCFNGEDKQVLDAMGGMENFSNSLVGEIASDMGVEPHLMDTAISQLWDEINNELFINDLFEEVCPR